MRPVIVRLVTQRSDHALLILVMLSILSMVIFWRRAESHLLRGAIAGITLYNVTNGTPTGFRYAMPGWPSTPSLRHCSSRRSTCVGNVRRCGKHPQTHRNEVYRCDRNHRGELGCPSCQPAKDKQPHASTAQPQVEQDEDDVPGERTRRSAGLKDEVPIPAVVDREGREEAGCRCHGWWHAHTVKCQEDAVVDRGAGQPDDQEGQRLVHAVPTGQEPHCGVAWMSRTSACTRSWMPTSEGATASSQVPVLASFGPMLAMIAQMPTAVPNASSRLPVNSRRATAEKDQSTYLCHTRRQKPRQRRRMILGTTAGMRMFDTSEP